MNGLLPIHCFDYRSRAIAVVCHRLSNTLFPSGLDGSQLSFTVETDPFKPPQEGRHRKEIAVQHFPIIFTTALTVKWNIWGGLILFPLYFGYSGSDGVAGILRTIIYVNGVAVRIYIVSYLGRRFSIDKIPHLLLLHLLLFFPGLLVLLYLVPVNNSFNLLGFILIIIFQNALISIILGTEGVLRQRFMLDLIPAENRNAVYSLIPTLIALFSIPIMPVAGWLIDTYGLSAGVSLAFGTTLLGTIFIGLAIYLRSRTLKSTIKSTITGEREGVAVVA